MYFWNVKEAVGERAPRIYLEVSDYRMPNPRGVATVASRCVSRQEHLNGDVRPNVGDRAELRVILGTLPRSRAKPQQ